VTPGPTTVIAPPDPRASDSGSRRLPAPFANGRPLGSALYFLVTPTAPVRLHRIRNGQLYHYYLGDPLEVFMLHNDGTVEHVVVGPDIRAGQRVQLHIPGNTFHTARLLDDGAWFLGAAPVAGRGPAGRRDRRPRRWRQYPRSRPTCGQSPRRSATSSRPAGRDDLAAQSLSPVVVAGVILLASPWATVDAAPA
jgi:hypothetical protein